MRFGGPGGGKGRKVRRGMWTAVAAGCDEHFGEPLEHWAYAGCRERSSGKLRAEKLEQQGFGQAEKIGLRALAIARRILCDGAEQQANCLAAGFFHSAV